MAVIIALALLLYRSRRRHKEQQRRHDEMVAASLPFAPQFVSHHTPLSPPTSPPPVFSNLRGMPNDSYSLSPGGGSGGAVLPEGGPSPGSPRNMQVDVKELAREVVALMNMPSGSGNLPRTPSEVASTTALDPRNRSDSNISGNRADNRPWTLRH